VDLAFDPTLVALVAVAFVAIVVVAAVLFMRRR